MRVCFGLRLEGAAMCVSVKVVCVCALWAGVLLIHFGSGCVAV
jgi:hypothetical protein